MVSGVNYEGPVPLDGWWPESFVGTCVRRLTAPGAVDTRSPEEVVAAFYEADSRAGFCSTALLYAPLIRAVEAGDVRQRLLKPKAATAEEDDE